jgi:hypothetical protein
MVLTFTDDRLTGGPSSFACSRWWTVDRWLVASHALTCSWWATHSAKVAERSSGTTNSGNHSRTRPAHVSVRTGGPPGTKPTSSARPTYLRTVLRSSPSELATWALGRPAYQCSRISTTSITANDLLTNLASRVFFSDVVRLWTRRPRWWVSLHIPCPVGNSLTARLGNYLTEGVGNYLTKLLPSWGIN